MWHFLVGKQEESAQLTWSKYAGSSLALPADDDGIVIAILETKDHGIAFAAVEEARRLVSEVRWICPSDSTWLFDLKVMTEEREYQVDWLSGTPSRVPEYTKRLQDFPGWGASFKTGVLFFFTRRSLESEFAASSKTTGLSCDNRWAVLRVLGKGGQGTVYLVRDEDSHGRVETGRHADATALIKAIQLIAKGGSGGSTDRAVEDLVRTISTIGDQDFSNLAALKLLHGEEGRHFEGQDERIARETAL